MIKTVVIGICTGCHKKILPGSYFSRRIKRHLNDGLHNHDAMRMVNIPANSADLRDGFIHPTQNYMLLKKGWTSVAPLRSR